MKPTVKRLLTVVRRVIAVHEAGHAAVSLALGQGHQVGVSMAGWHIVDDQPDLTKLPATLAIREAVKRGMVALAGPIAQARATGGGFDANDFDADDPHDDAATVVHAITVIDRHLGAGVISAQHLATATAKLLEQPSMVDLVEAIMTALVRQQAVDGDRLGEIVDAHPIDPNFIRIPLQVISEATAAR